MHSYHYQRALFEIKKKQQLKQANNVGYVFHYWIAFLFIYAIVVLDYTNSPTKV